MLGGVGVAGAHVAGLQLFELLLGAEFIGLFGWKGRLAGVLLEERRRGGGQLGRVVSVTISKKFAWQRRKSESTARSSEGLRRAERKIPRRRVRVERCFDLPLANLLLAQGTFRCSSSLLLARISRYV